MPLFNRIVSVKTGKKGNENVLNVSKNRVVFKVSKTHTAKDNIAEIEIYNLNENSRSLFSDVSNFIIIEAGYSEFEGLKTIFVGNITEFQIIKVDAYIITKITALDGHNAVSGKVFSKSYKEGTPPKNIIEDVLNGIGLPKKFSKKASELLNKKNPSYNNGIAFSGNSKQVLNEITEYLNLSWSIQNNVVKITSVNATDDSDVIVLNENSGLIGSPIRLNEISKKVKKKGYEVVSLLRGDFEPTKPIIIESEFVKRSSFLTEEVVHSGDTEGNDWHSKLIVSEV